MRTTALAQECRPSQTVIVAANLVCAAIRFKLSTAWFVLGASKIVLCTAHLIIGAAQFILEPVVLSSVPPELFCVLLILSSVLLSSF